MSVFDESSGAACSSDQGFRRDDDRPAGMAEAPVLLPVRAAGDAPRMVIVEDAPLIALDLAETMRDLGFDVRATAFTHEQALAEIERSAPQFAVIDLHLGAGENGVQQAEGLLAILDDRGCRCLVFSGDEAACSRVAERYPHFSVLAKPAQPDRLVREMQKLRNLGAR